MFLALAAPLIFALILMSLESARSACLRFLLRQASESSLRSVFAAYDGDVFAAYGLMLAKAGGSTSPAWPSEVQRYAEKYLAPGAGTLFDGADRVRTRSVEAEGLDQVLITDGEGRIFAEVITDYMKTAGLAGLIQEVLSRLGLYSEEDGLGLFDSLKNMTQDKDGSIDGILGSYRDLKDQAGELQRQARQAAEEEGGEPPPAASGGEVKADLLEQLKAIREHGLIAIITGNTPISTYSWQDDTLPSHLPDAEKLRHADIASDISLIDHFLMGEYLFKHMGNYRHHATIGASYEVEYVLSGKNSDKAALETVVGELLLIRVGLNLAYLMTDAEKQAEAETFAALLMSLLALPELILLLKWLLITAWALAESIVDLRALMRGKKVPFFKSAASWKLSSMKLDLLAEGGSENGLAYEDYLRLLFYIGRSENQSYRMMDVIQKRIRLETPAFLMKEKMVCAAVSVTATAPYLYIPFAWFRRLTGTGLRYTSKASYGYERR